MSARQDPFVVNRYDVAIEPAPEEKPILTIGAVTIDGHPVALLLDPEDRAKVARWLAPDVDDELAVLRARVAELEAAAKPLPVVENCPICGEGLDDENISDFCSDRCSDEYAELVKPVPQPRQAEDPHDSELHHDYALGRDLPAIPHQQDRRAL